MRIGQLARRLGLPPSDILGYLAGRNLVPESGPDAGANSRLSDEHVSIVVNHFAPGKLAEIVSISEQESVEAPKIEEQQEPVAEEVASVVEDMSSVTEEVSLEDVQPQPVEVIRVSKVELQGLKVLGKIELPQPKKKTEDVVEGEAPAQETSAPVRPPRKQYPKRNDRRDRQWKNPIELKRQREAEEAERRRQEQAEKQKEKKANHYYSKVKSVPTKAVRRIEEQTVVEDIEVKEPPKSIVGKFIKWLTS